MQRLVSPPRYFLVTSLLFVTLSSTVAVARGDKRQTPPLRPAESEAVPEPLPVEAAPPVSQAQLAFDAGKEMLKTRKFAEAAAQLQYAVDKAAVENLPFEKQALMHYVLGVALSRAERVPQAIAAYQKSLSLNPADAECHLDLAN